MSHARFYCNICHRHCFHLKYVHKVTQLAKDYRKDIICGLKLLTGNTENVTTCQNEDIPRHVNGQRLRYVRQLVTWTSNAKGFGHGKRLVGSNDRSVKPDGSYRAIQVLRNSMGVGRVYGSRQICVTR